MDVIYFIRDLVANDNLMDAFRQFRGAFGEHENQVIQLMGRNARLEQNERDGIISVDNATLERNRIRYALLSLVTEMELKQKGLPEFPLIIRDKPVFEKLFSESRLHRIDWLQEGLVKSKAVCKIHTPQNIGTGFLVSDGYVFTNHHVISEPSLVKKTQIEFGYDDPDTLSVMYDLEPDTFVTSETDDLDFSRVRIRPNSNLKPLSEWGALTISQTLPDPADILTIIQHPQGRRKEIAFSNSDTIIYDRWLHYTISTEAGSSGSPVFDMNWQVVALHHASGNFQINAQGDKKNTNRGILFQQIIRQLAA